MIKVLIVDDSAMMRRAVKAILETDSEIEVVGVARDGEDALKKDIELRPDVITMDINMPVMDGLTCMLHLFEQHPGVQVIMLSSLTHEGATTTFEALELGAFDYVGKPSGTVSKNLHIIGKELIAKIKAAVQSRKRSKTVRQATRNGKAVSKPSETLASTAKKIVIIGVSTGGPGTLLEILPKLPADLAATVIVVQHMPAMFTKSFAKRLDDHCQISFQEAQGGERLLAGQGFVAPGGIHLTVKRNITGTEAFIRLTSYPEGQLFTPSVNVAMQSIVEVYGKNTVGVLLTGMGDDGANGMVAIREAGGYTIAEAESTAVVFGMPREAIERGGAQIVLPCHLIAHEIVKAVKRLGS